MARPSSTLDLPLYADLSFLAQRRRGLLRRAHASTPQARRLPIRRRSESRHQSLRRRDKRRSKTLGLDRRPPPRPRRCETRETSVRVDPLARQSLARSPQEVIRSPELAVTLGRFLIKSTLQARQAVFLTLASW